VKEEDKEEESNKEQKKSVAGFTSKSESSSQDVERVKEDEKLDKLSQEEIEQAKLDPDLQYVFLYGMINLFSD
jgi:hypothetical protein